jgi:hypothetical protein
MTFRSEFDPNSLPSELKEVEPKPCKQCGKRIWFNKPERLIFHEPEQCDVFKALMVQMGGIDISKERPKN